MKKSQNTTIMAVLVALALLFTAQMAIHAATVTNTYPGHPNKWEGMTTNTIIEIKLDTPVALIGSPPVPDIDYCVKKAEFNGLDFVFSDVSCATDVSDDRKTRTIHPADVLGENGLYAYKITNINFEGGGSQQNVAEYFETGDNPIPVLVTQVNETVLPSPPYETLQDMCTDEGGTLGLEVINYWCVRCHNSWAVGYPTVWGVCKICP
jgi:hypothetical protein